MSTFSIRRDLTPHISMSSHGLLRVTVQTLSAETTSVRLHVAGEPAWSSGIDIFINTPAEIAAWKALAYALTAIDVAALPIPASATEPPT